MAVITNKQDQIHTLSDNLFNLETKNVASILPTGMTTIDTKCSIDAENPVENLQPLMVRVIGTIRLFTNDTTIHGLRHTTEVGIKPYKRILWLILILTCAGVLTFQISDRILYYYSWPVTVNVKMNFNKTLKFPAVTICNHNAFKASVANKLGRYRLYESMFTSNGPVNTSFILEHGGNLTLGDIYVAAAHRKEDLIFSCIWKGKACGPDDFTMTLTDHGVCYTWNWQSEVLVGSPGVSNGLRLKLNIEQSEYMPGPHTASGIKFHLHESNEIPVVHALGKAVAVGSHVFAGIQFTEINNLAKPYGECSQTSLEYVSGYSLTACKLNCLSKLSEAECGCRHMYMPSMNGRPKLCTVTEYYNCLQNVIDSFPTHVEEKCNCPVPCTLYGFDTDISYASISKYAVNKYVNQNNTAYLAQALTLANEVTSRMDEDKLHELHEKSEDFEHKLHDIEFLFHHDLHELIHDVEHMVEDEFDQISSLCEWKTFLYDYQFFVVQKNFVRPRDAMEERHAHVVANAYNEFILTLEDKIRTLHNLHGSQHSIRQYLYYDILNQIDSRKEIVERTITNYTELINAYDTGTNIFNYKYDLAPKSHNPYVVPATLLYESLHGNNASSLAVEQFNTSLYDIVSCLHEFKLLSFDIYNSSVFNETLLETTVNQFISSMLSWLSSRQTVYYDVIERPLRVLEETTADFKRICFAYDSIALSINNKIEVIDQKVEAIEDTLLDPLHEIHDTLHEYVLNSIGYKYIIAGNITSGKILAGKSNLESFMYELMSIDADLRTLLNTLLPLSLEIHRIVHEDVNAYRYYDFLGKTELLRNFSEVKTEIESSFVNYTSQIQFYKVIGQDGLEFSSAVVELVEFFQEYLDSLKLDDKYIRENFAQLDIFYKQMNYEEITQQKAYDKFALFCDIGGSMGLFLGASLLSLCEIFDFLWCTFCRSKKSSNQHTSSVVPIKVNSTD